MFTIVTKWRALQEVSMNIKSVKTGNDIKSPLEPRVNADRITTWSVDGHPSRAETQATAVTEASGARDNRKSSDVWRNVWTPKSVRKDAIYGSSVTADPKFGSVSSALQA